MAQYATLEVTIADVEPVAGFIARMIRAMTAQDAAGLPGTVAAGLAELQSAVRDLGVTVPREALDGTGDAL
jgi:hypothetical protein